MQIVLELISIGIVSTLAMTAFSYGLSAITKSKFEEPQLINILFKSAGIFEFALYREHILGWALHIVIGILFVFCYYGCLALEWLDTSLFSGALFGFFAGIVGMFVWGVALKLHPNPPTINRTGYLLQLIPAHIIFGLSTSSLF